MDPFAGASVLAQLLRGGAQPVAYRNTPGLKPFDAMIEGGGRGMGPAGGASGKPVVAPDYSPQPGYGSTGATRQFGGEQAARRDAIAAGLQAGKSYGQIAKELGISRNAVAGSVRDLGLTKDPLGQRDPYSLDELELQNTRTRLNPGDIPRDYGAEQKRPVGMPQFNFTQQPAPPDDAEMAKAMADYLAKMGLGQ